MKVLKNCSDFLLKKIFKGPNCTPTYLLQLETELDEILIHTVKLHINYIFKILKLPQYRISSIVPRDLKKKV